MMRWPAFPAVVLLLGSLFLSCFVSNSWGADPRENLPLPRYVSTRSAPVNVRTGPGERYPVTWVLLRKGMPVEIVAEYENWRKIRDWLGTEGWVNQALLSGRRVVVVTPEDGVLRATPHPVARPVARMQKGVLAQLVRCEPSWCELRTGSLTGWVGKTAIWGVYSAETGEW